MTDRPMTDPRSKHPAYAILDGALHRQDVPGGRWTLLDRAETARLLSLLAGIGGPTADPRLPTAGDKDPV